MYLCIRKVVSSYASPRHEPNNCREEKPDIFPFTHARKKGEGEEGSGHYCQDFVSTWYVRNVITRPISFTYVDPRLVNEMEAQCPDMQGPLDTL